MTTKYIPITPLNFHSEIRVDTMGDEVAVSVYNCDIKHLDLLIQQLEALKAEQVKPEDYSQFKMPVQPYEDPESEIENDEPAEMTAVLGPKVDSTARIVAQPEPMPEPKPAQRSEPTKYFTCAETATFVRQALKEAFPTQKFTVRSKVYSGGASITVGWLDGMTEYEVNQVVQRFSGADFDGMIDLKSNIYRNDENGVNVSYGADYIFCKRDYSKDLTLRLAAQVAKFSSIELPEMNKWEWFDNDIRLDDGQYFTTRLNEARYCYSVTAGKYIGSRFGYLPQWIECMIS